MARIYLVVAGNERRMRRFFLYLGEPLPPRDLRVRAHMDARARAVFDSFRPIYVVGFRRCGACAGAGGVLVPPARAKDEIKIK